jgi:hypothetical protein
VTFAEANIVHVGDTYWNGIYPFIDYSTGGSIDGMIADANLAATTNDTIIIPGAWPARQQQSRAHGIPRHAGSLFGTMSQSSISKEAHETRPSRQNQPPLSMPNGANLSSIPGTSPGWSMKASDRGPSQQR